MMTKHQRLYMALTLILVTLFTVPMVYAVTETASVQDALPAHEMSGFSGDLSSTLPGYQYRNPTTNYRAVLGFGQWLLSPLLMALVTIHLFYIGAFKAGYHLFLKHLFIPHSIHAPPFCRNSERAACYVVSLSPCQSILINEG